jgi:hypothetical protein
MTVVNRLVVDHQCVLLAEDPRSSIGENALQLLAFQQSFLLSMVEEHSLEITDEIETVSNELAGVDDGGEARPVKQSVEVFELLRRELENVLQDPVESAWRLRQRFPDQPERQPRGLRFLGHGRRRRYGNDVEYLALPFLRRVLASPLYG